MQRFDPPSPTFTLLQTELHNIYIFVHKNLRIRGSSCKFVHLCVHVRVKTFRLVS